jgi:hypothetical protein
MTAITAAFHHTVSAGTRPFADLVDRLHEMLHSLVNPYHPERHYMRGPGPAWCKKHGVASPLAAGKR